tara:strand:+ start:245 stop:658 length:414 start_codon:yes stop_codon:yes gene_type:complete
VITGARRAIIAIDFVDDALKQLNVDFRIIRDVNEIGNNAVWEDLGGAQGIEAATVQYIEPALYPTGTMTMRYDFVEAGRYVGIVTAENPEGGQIFRSVFPFAVGLIDYFFYGKVAGFIILFGIALYYFSERRKRQAA